MKSLTHKLLALVCIFALFTGCASVTDTGIDTQPQQPQAEQIVPDQDNDDADFGSESDMSTILDKPE